MDDPMLWIRFAVVLITPFAIYSDRGRILFMEEPYRLPIWTILLMSAAAGVLARYGLLLKSIQNDMALLLTVPALQAGTFVLLTPIFRLLVGRYPLAFDAARLGRRNNGKRHVPDMVFWLPTYLVVIFVGIAVCIHFDIELPRRYRHHAQETANKPLQQIARTDRAPAEWRRWAS
jgi:hypothetical protein